MTRTLTLILLSIITTTIVVSQDLQLSQYYAIPMSLNPAFAGATENNRVGLDYRHQWTGAGGAAIGQMVAVEHYFDQYNSGIGLIVNRTNEGLGDYKVMNYSLIYAYELQLDKNHTFHGGLQYGRSNSSINYSALSFGDQFDQNGLTGGGTTEQFAQNGTSYNDLSFGILGFSYNAFYGFSAHHLNQPTISLTGEGNNLPTKYSLHGGYKWHLDHQGEGQYEKPEHSLILTGNYKTHGVFDQFDIGTYLINEPFIIGLWYRGIPIIGDQLAESVVFIAGIHQKKLHIGYSYDLVLNGLLTRGGAVHEISLSYEFQYPLQKADHLHNIKRNNKVIKRLPCPKF